MAVHTHSSQRSTNPDARRLSSDAYDPSGRSQHAGDASCSPISLFLKLCVWAAVFSHYEDPVLIFDNQGSDFLLSPDANNIHGDFLDLGASAGVFDLNRQNFVA